MKKINKLIPIIALGSIAAILPASACTINISPAPQPEPEDDAYKVNNKWTDSSGSLCLRSELAHMVKGEEIKFEIKWSDCVEVGAKNQNEGWSVNISNPVNPPYEAYVSYFDQSSCHIYIDGVDYIGKGITLDDMGQTIYPTGQLNITENSTISGAITLLKLVYHTESAVEVEDADLYIFAYGA